MNTNNVSEVYHISEAVSKNDLPLAQIVRKLHSQEISPMRLPPSNTQLVVSLCLGLCPRPGPLHNCVDQLVLIDEDLDAIENEEENKQNGEILDPPILDLLPETWRIAEQHAQGFQQICIKCIMRSVNHGPCGDNKIRHNRRSP